MENTLQSYALLPGSRFLTVIFATMLSLLLSGVSPVLAEVAACSAHKNVPPPVEQALDTVLKQILQSELGGAPGAVLSVRGAAWRYAKSAGTANLSNSAPIVCGMPFQIGSNTKMMTASVLLQLQEEGRLSINDRLAEHLPELAERLPFGQIITLRQLAQHTSGVFSYTDNAPDGTPGLMERAVYDKQALRRQLSPEEMIEFVVAHGQPTFSPGEDGEWSYSNTGYTLLGLVIEKIEKLPLGKSLEARIFAPLGMERTYFWNGIPRPQFGLPHAYLAPPFNYETSDWNMSQGWAAGAVVSTTEDMHVFIEALVEGKLFQHPETLSEMMTTTATTHPALLGYGLGLANKGPDLWGHGGQTLGFESEVAAFTDSGISIVGWGTSSSNALGFGAFLVSEALRKAGPLKD